LTDIISSSCRQPPCTLDMPHEIIFKTILNSIFKNQLQKTTPKNIHNLATKFQSKSPSKTPNSVRIPSTKSPTENNQNTTFSLHTKTIPKER
jgi:hypothetical protein